MNLAATIHVGASSVSMLILGDGQEVIDYLEKPAPLAHDIFGTGTIRLDTIERITKIILGFREVLAEMDAIETPVRAVGFNSLSEAVNVEAFRNRLLIACGLNLETLDDGEMTRLVFLKTRRRLHDTPSMRKRTTIVAHVGPGNTRLLLFQAGKVIRYHSYRLGTHRTSESLKQPDLLGEPGLRLIREHITPVLAQIRFDFRHDEIQDIVIIGQEIQLLSPYLSRPKRTKSSVETLRQLAQEVASVPETGRVNNYGLDYPTAAAIVPSLAINLALAEVFEVTSVRVSQSDYQHGLLSDLAQHSELATDYHDEVINSAKILASRYQADPKHANHVTSLSLRLFDETQDLHQLNGHDRFLLEIAGILHEVGNFITSLKHEEHSQYIVRQSEIFGLNYHDKAIVALITRYHRGPSPKPAHAYYKDLDQADRLRVSKLASLLRVADALERTHSQRIKDFGTTISGGVFRIQVDGLSDATAERLALRSKGRLFTELFGLQLALTE